MSSLTRKLSCHAMGCLLLSIIATPLLAIEGTWQVGASAGVSKLSPDADGSGLTLEEDQSSALNVYFLLDITPVIATELAFTDLGEAELSGNEPIEYEAISLGATAYVWGSSEAQRRSEGLSAYVKLGLSSIQNESDIDLDESDNIALWFGAGVQYPVANNFGLRAELVSYDGDAQALLGGVYWRPGSSNRRRAAAPRTQPATQAPVATTQSSPLPSADNNRTERVRPPVQTSPQPSASQQPRTVQSTSQCPPEAAARISDATSCAILNSVLTGVAFNGNTATLLPSSTPALTQLVQIMQANPNVSIEIRGHTQSLGNAQAEAQLSSQRVRSVALFLVQNGVPVSRLSAKAFGATQPVGDNATVQGRSVNNRIELRSK